MTETRIERVRQTRILDAIARDMRVVGRSCRADQITLVWDHARGEVVAEVEVEVVSSRGPAGVGA